MISSNQQLEEEDIKRKELSFKKSSLQEILDNVTHHIKDERVDQFIHILENKFFSKLSKYTNEFVEKTRRKSLSHEMFAEAKLFNLIKKTPREGSSVHFKPKLEKKDSNSDDSYISETQQQSEAPKKKERNFFGYNKETSEDLRNLKKRSEDINNLELGLFKSKNTGNINNGQLTEIYYHFKKKL